MTDPSDAYSCELSSTYRQAVLPSRVKYFAATAAAIIGVASAYGIIKAQTEPDKQFRPAARSETIVVPERRDSLADRLR